MTIESLTDKLLLDVFHKLYFQSKLNISKIVDGYFIQLTEGLFCLVSIYFAKFLHLIPYNKYTEIVFPNGKNHLISQIMNLIYQSMAIIFWHIKSNLKVNYLQP